MSPSHGIAYDAWAGTVAPRAGPAGDARHPRPHLDRHHGRPAVRHLGAARGSAARQADRRGLPSRGGAVRRRRGLRLAAHRRTTGPTSAPNRRSPATPSTATSAARPAPAAWPTRSATSSTPPATGTCCSWRRSRSSGGTSAPPSAARTCSPPSRARSWPATPAETWNCAGSSRRSSRRRRRRSGWRSGSEHDITISPVNTPATIAADPQFADRMPWQPAGRLVADQLPFPVRVVGEQPPAAAAGARRRPAHAQILTEVLGYDAERIAALRAAGRSARESLSNRYVRSSWRYECPDCSRARSRS